ncbi:hypothetical protein [Oceaniglobus indicus]|uniref:hypothetical protein n=1 Tax=Oceaniglobus indicus TaxID=2047749 RepID=UPI0011AB79FF|nr:hypothetical protein [Oceaniglobus indicus]
MKTILAALALALPLSATSATADCSYMGGYYATGSTICSAGGWLEQCTIAGYWSAIGSCKADDNPSGLKMDPNATAAFARDPDLEPKSEEKTDEAAASN